jgi:hypothetical protein
MKKSNWFGPIRKPDLVGVYETKDELGTTGFQHWNGKFWGYYAGSSVKVAKDGAGKESTWQENKWRGLAEDPRKAAQP